MLKAEDFRDNPVLLDLVEKLNKFLEKEKNSKVSKTLEELEGLLLTEELTVPITYILSVLAEDRVDLITKTVVEKIEKYVREENLKLKLNSISILGFYALSSPELIQKYAKLFFDLLSDKIEDVKDNAYYFLQAFVKVTPELASPSKPILLNALAIEKDKERVIFLLNLLDKVENLNIRQIFRLKELLKQLIPEYYGGQNPDISLKIKSLLKKHFTWLKNIDLDNATPDQLLTGLETSFFMRKRNFTEFSKKKGIQLKEYLTQMKKIVAPIKDQVLYFYAKDKDKNILYFYELEKEKFTKFFEKDIKLSHTKIIETFSPILETNEESELKMFMNVLIQLKLIDGYYSKFFFYPRNYIKSEMLDKLHGNGMITVKKYDYLPNEFLKEIIDDIGKSTNQEFLLGKGDQVYYSLKSILTQINTSAAKNCSIDLMPFRERLIDSEFIKLIKKLSKEYLTDYHKGTHWLTNIGTTRVKNELENSKVLGFLDLNKISERLNVRKILLMDYVGRLVDLRSGIWDIDDSIFYYSKYVKDKIEKLNLIPDEQERLKQINAIAKELNIEKSQILSKIDENIKAIGEEIKKQDQIKTGDYLEKTGMNSEAFMKFVDELGLNYLKKGDLLILNPARIEEAKNNFKKTLIEQAKSENTISFDTFNISSNLIEDLIKELQTSGLLKGIFHQTEEGKQLFYTMRGIKSLMMENSSFFSFNEIFYGKELSESETALMKEAFNDLLKERKLKGKFDEESLTFSSSEIIFANDYNSCLAEFERLVNAYIEKFDKEFQKIKKILNKREETIYPQEIKAIQESIDRINKNYVFWRNHIESYMRQANKTMLEKQGLDIKRFRNLSEEKKEEIKSFEQDPEVYDLKNGFERWIKLFNELELKYPNVIYYQKHLLNNPEDEEGKQKLADLTKVLNLI